MKITGGNDLCFARILWMGVRNIITLGLLVHDQLANLEGLLGYFRLYNTHFEPNLMLEEVSRKLV